MDTSTPNQSETDQQGTHEREETQEESTVESNVDSAEKSSEEQEAEMLAHAREAFDIPEGWTDNQLLQWLNKPVDDKRGVKTETGIFRHDPTRAQRKPNAWPTEELLAALKGELDDVSGKRMAELIAEYRRRETLEAAWSDQQVLDYFRKGITPEKTSYGAWVYDRTRPQRQAHEWTTEELLSWAEGELKASGKANDTKLAMELKKRHSLKTVDNSVEEILAAYNYQFSDNTEDDSSPVHEQKTPQLYVHAEPTPTYNGALTDMNLSFIDGVLDRYVATVATNSIVGDAAGGKAQRELDNLFSYVTRLDGPAMADALDKIKTRIIKERNGVFSPSNAYRFVHLLKGDRKHQQRHVNLIELFLIVTDRNASSRRKQVDIRHMLSGFSPSVTERLADYFQNYA